MKYNLRSWNDLLDAAFPSEQFLVDPYLVRGGITFLFGPKSTGKCFGINDLVLSADGSTLPAGSVCPGQSLMGEDCSPRVVQEVHRGRGEMWEIHHHGSGFRWTASGGHLLTLVLGGELQEVGVQDFATWSAWRQREARVAYRGRGWAELLWRDRTGLSVRPIGEGEWVGFSVDGDHRHLLADYSLTHNSPLQWSWATSIGSGESWMGLPTSKGRALILEMDQPEGTVQKRVAAMGPKDGVWFLSGPPMNVPNVGQETLLELKRAREVAKPDVVFFNTLRQTTCLPLEDGTTARHVYAFAKEQFPGSALVFIHHPKKSPPSNVHIDEDEMFSGSNAWRNDAQVSLHLQKFLHKERGKRKSTARLRHTGSQVSPLYRPLPLLLGRDGTTWSSPLVDELKALRALAFETDLTGGALDKEAVKKGLFASYATARRRRQMLEAGFGVSREWLGLERYEDEQEEAQEAEGGGEGGEQG